MHGYATSINIVGVSGKIIKKNTKVEDLLVEDRMGYRTPIQCIGLDKTCGNALRIDPHILQTLGQIVSIPGDIFVAGGEIDLLIGMSCPCLHQQILMYGDNHGLMIMETRFGSTLVGRIPNSNCSNYECGIVNTCQISFDGEDALLKVVETELTGIEKECACNGRRIVVRK